VQLAILPKVLKIVTHALHEFHVMYPRFQVAPNVIDVQLLPPLRPTLRAGGCELHLAE
jgi:hypothetical protein